MIDALKTLENDVVTEEVSNKLKRLGKAKVPENKMQAVTAELREEFARSTNMIKQQWLKPSIKCLTKNLAKKLLNLEDPW